MRSSHFEAFAPVCPHCLSAQRGQHPLTLTCVEQRTGDLVEEGVLTCSDDACRLEYPIIDGIPILLPDVRSYLRDQISSFTARSDFSATISSMLGDAAGQGSEFDTRRQHLSIYGWDGYAEFGTEQPVPGAVPGSVTRCLTAALELTDGISGSAIDIGCSIGRSTFDLAEHTDGLILGADLNFNMLQVAQRVLRDGVARFPKRRIGLVYDEQIINTPFAGQPNVDFWLCDSLAPPFVSDSFGAAVALNLLDCVQSPMQLLHVLGDIVKPGGNVLISTPYDWSEAATPVEAWLGGHSQRSDTAGAAEPIMQALLSPDVHPSAVSNLSIKDQLPHFPWHARLHERSIMHYDVHVLALDVA